MADEENRPRQVRRGEQVPAMTIGDLVDWCAQRALDPTEVTVTAAYLKWESAETDEERGRRIRAEVAADKRREDWERGMYDRLREKFEGETDG